MKTNTVKAALKRGEASIGSWASLASPLAARYFARTGFPWLTVDLEHSPASWETAALMFAQIADAGAVPLARVPCCAHDQIKRALDSGAWGIIVPMVNTREEAERAVAAARYAPVGTRSVGGNLHAMSFDAEPAEYYARANEEILVVVQSEHVEAVEHADEILSVPGLDAMFVGPNDLLSSMGKTPAMDSDDPEFVDALRTLRETAKRHGVAPGIHTGSVEAAARRRAEGWQLIALGSDLMFLVAGAQDAGGELGAGGRRDAGAY